MCVCGGGGQSGRSPVMKCTKISRIKKRSTNMSMLMVGACGVMRVHRNQSHAQ